jgi:hypothetical protein
MFSLYCCSCCVMLTCFLSRVALALLPLAEKRCTTDQGPVGFSVVFNRYFFHALFYIYPTTMYP